MTEIQNSREMTREFQSFLNERGKKPAIAATHITITLMPEKVWPFENEKLPQTCEPVIVFKEFYLF
jgi:hypothetical protein